MSTYDENFSLVCGRKNYFILRLHLSGKRKEKYNVGYRSELNRCKSRNVKCHIRFKIIGELFGFESLTRSSKIITSEIMIFIKLTNSQLESQK